MYQSTRSENGRSAASALLTGIAPDGGLFVNPEIEKIDLKTVLGKSYSEMAEIILNHFLPGFGGTAAKAAAAYAPKFDDPEICPVKDAGGRHILELWHGPTSAFKDLALTVLPYYISAARELEGVSENVSILTATSGDTGKAALEGFHDVAGTDITVFFPHGGVSEMQRLQMVTQEGSNVRVCAVRGNFDDCQRGVKESFAANKGRKFLSSANSINIGRLVPQIVYYFYAYSKIAKNGETLDFAVPTGNFGDILAGYMAKKAGLPVGRLICVSNSNNVLYDFINTGVYDRRRGFVKTVSPSMDILVSSNLERLLFYASHGNTKYVASLMEQLNEKGWYKVDDEIMREIRNDFDAQWCGEEECKASIGRLYADTGYLQDTHTACAFSKAPEGSVVLSTASPFKFPQAVSEAVGKDIYSLGIEPPKNLVGLENRKILHTDVIDKDEVVEYALS